MVTIIILLLLFDSVHNKLTALEILKSLLAKGVEILETKTQIVRMILAIYIR